MSARLVARSLRLPLTETPARFGPYVALGRKRARCRASSRAIEFRLPEYFSARPGVIRIWRYLTGNGLIRVGFALSMRLDLALLIKADFPNPSRVTSVWKTSANGATAARRDRASSLATHRYLVDLLALNQHCLPISFASG
jgi:hypothetical protein